MPTPNSKAVAPWFVETPRRLVDAIGRRIRDEGFACEDKPYASPKPGLYTDAPESVVADACFGAADELDEDPMSFERWLRKRYGAKAKS